MNRKGISPLIAAVLLIAFTLAVAALLTAWVTTYFGETTDQLGNESERLIDCSYAGVSIFSATHHQADNNVTVNVANTGTATLGSVAVVVTDSNGAAYNQEVSAPSTGSVETADVSVDSGVSIDEVRVTSTRCPEVSDTTTDISVQ